MSEGRYDLHEVSAKAAIFTPKNEVLIMEYLPAKHYTGFGLPGGHVDAGESPDFSMARELQEELGLEGVALERRDFFVHRSGKIVLGYFGTLENEQDLKPLQPEKEHAVLMNKEQFDAIKIDDAYRKFVLNNWPQV